MDTTGQKMYACMSWSGVPAVAMCAAAQEEFFCRGARDQWE